MEAQQNLRWQGKSGGWSGDTFVASVWTLICIWNASDLWRGLGHMSLIKGLTCGMLAFLSPILVVQKLSLLLERWKARQA